MPNHTIVADQIPYVDASSSKVAIRSALGVVSYDVQTLSDSAKAQSKSNIGAGDPAIALLNIDLPTYDLDPSALHCDFFYSETPLFGYHWWMSYSPYPNSLRELPSVAASVDGSNWELPPGTRNPLATFNEITLVSNPGGSNPLNMDTPSDPDILLDHDGRIRVYYMANRNAAVTFSSMQYVRSDAALDADGLLPWSYPVEVLFNPGASNRLEAITASPAVIKEYDGITDTPDGYAMWYLGLTGVMSRRLSADGFTWEAPTVCTHPDWEGSAGVIQRPAHLDVCREVIDGAVRYTALIMGARVDYPCQLNTYISTDGLTWTLSKINPIPQDVLGPFMYRSGIQPSIKGAGYYDVAYANMSHKEPDNAASVNRIAIIRGLRLDGSDDVVYTDAPTRNAKPIGGINRLKPNLQEYFKGQESTLNRLHFEYFTNGTQLSALGSVIISGAKNKAFTGTSSAIAGKMEIFGQRTDAVAIGGVFVSAPTTVTLAIYGTSCRFLGDFALLITNNWDANLTSAQAAALAGKVLSAPNGASATIHKIVRQPASTRYLIYLKNFTSASLFTASAQALSIDGAAIFQSDGTTPITVNHTASAASLPIANALNIFFVEYGTDVTTPGSEVGYDPADKGGYYQAFNSHATYGMHFRAEYTTVR